MERLSKIRQSLRERRKQLSEKTQKKASNIICEQIQEAPFFQEATHCAFYIPIDNEVSPLPLISAAHQAGKACYLPAIEANNNLKFIAFKPGDELKKNQWGIAEPTSNTSIPPEALSCVIVPGIAFNAAKHRLGYGKGFYDRCFAFKNTPDDKDKKPLLIGIAYAFQVLPPWTPASHDISMDMIFTDESIY